MKRRLPKTLILVYCISVFGSFLVHGLGPKCQSIKKLLWMSRSCFLVVFKIDTIVFQLTPRSGAWILLAKRTISNKKSSGWTVVCVAATHIVAGETVLFHDFRFVWLTVLLCPRSIGALFTLGRAFCSLENKCATLCLGWHLCAVAAERGVFPDTNTIISCVANKRVKQGDR